MCFLTRLSLVLSKRTRSSVDRRSLKTECMTVHLNLVYDGFWCTDLSEYLRDSTSCRVVAKLCQNCDTSGLEPA